MPSRARRSTPPEVPGPCGTKRCSGREWPVAAQAACTETVAALAGAERIEAECIEIGLVARAGAAHTAAHIALEAVASVHTAVETAETMHTATAHIEVAASTGAETAAIAGTAAVPSASVDSVAAHRSKAEQRSAVAAGPVDIDMQAVEPEVADIALTA